MEQLYSLHNLQSAANFLNNKLLNLDTTNTINIKRVRGKRTLFTKVRTTHRMFTLIRMISSQEYLVSNILSIPLDLKVFFAGSTTKYR